MKRIGVVGLGRQAENANAMKRFTLPKENRDQAVVELCAKIKAKELVYLATCNRVEWIFVTEEGTSVDEYRRRIHSAMGGHTLLEPQRELRAWQGEGAVEHVMLVTMGLDSSQLGESEILGQVRDAFELARGLELAQERLVPLFQESMKLARRARRQTQLNLGRTSLAEIGLDQVRAALVRRPGPVALLGVSPMTERCARELIEEGHRVLLVNRSPQRAMDLAAQLGHKAEGWSLSDFAASPPPITAVMSATACEGPLLNREQMARLQQNSQTETPRPLLVDFATDPDLDPQVAQELGFDRLGMGEMLTIAERSREARLLRSGEARNLVDEALQRMMGTLDRRSTDRAISAMRESWLAFADQEVETLLRKQLKALNTEETEALRQFAARLAKRFAHLPSNGLRQLVSSHGESVVHTFFEKTDPELANRLEQALDPTTLFASLGDNETS